MKAASRRLIVHLQGLPEMAWLGDQVPQRSRIHASHCMEVCSQQAMLFLTGVKHAGASAYMASEVAEFGGQLK